MAENESKAQASEGVAAGTKEVEAPLGTMLIVLVYGAGTIILWFYMYYILLKSDGLLGGF